MRLFFSVSILAVSLAMAFVADAYARGGGHGSRGGRVSYGGGHHTTSHGGTFVGGLGSSHRGGTYSNPATSNQYGTHK
jgi:hypothetical protein